MDNMWLAIAGAALILVVLGWIFSFMVRDLGWNCALRGLGFTMFGTGVIVTGTLLLAIGIKGEL